MDKMQLTKLADLAKQTSELTKQADKLRAEQYTLAEVLFKEFQAGFSLLGAEQQEYLLTMLIKDAAKKQLKLELKRNNYRAEASVCLGNETLFYEEVDL